MEQIEKQALLERIKKATDRVREEATHQSAADPYGQGVQQATRVMLTQLDGLRQFAESLDVESAEDYLATVLGARSTARKQQKKSKVKR